MPLPETPEQSALLRRDEMAIAMRVMAIHKEKRAGEIRAMDEHGVSIHWDGTNEAVSIRYPWRNADFLQREPQFPIENWKAIVIYSPPFNEAELRTRLEHRHLKAEIQPSSYEDPETQQTVSGHFTFYKPGDFVTQEDLDQLIEFLRGEMKPGKLLAMAELVFIDDRGKRIPIESSVAKKRITVLLASLPRSIRNTAAVAIMAVLAGCGAVGVSEALDHFSDSGKDQGYQPEELERKIPDPGK